MQYEIPEVRHRLAEAISRKMVEEIKICARRAGVKADTWSSWMRIGPPLERIPSVCVGLGIERSELDEVVDRAVDEAAFRLLSVGELTPGAIARVCQLPTPWHATEAARRHGERIGVIAVVQPGTSPTWREPDEVTVETAFGLRESDQ